MTLQQVHAAHLSKSTQLSEIQVANVIRPLEVIRVLNAAKIRFVLVGAYGLAGARSRGQPKFWTWWSR